MNVPREREKERDNDVCVCVCVRERERAREREGGRGGERRASELELASPMSPSKKRDGGTLLPDVHHHETQKLLGDRAALS